MDNHYEYETEEKKQQIYQKKCKDELIGCYLIIFGIYYIKMLTRRSLVKLTKENYDEYKDW